MFIKELARKNQLISSKEGSFRISLKLVRKNIFGQKYNFPSLSVLILNVDYQTLLIVQ